MQQQNIPVLPRKHKNLQELHSKYNNQDIYQAWDESKLQKHTRVVITKSHNKELRI